MNTTDYNNFAIVQQPISTAVYSDPAPRETNIYESGSIEVRNLCKEDGDFSGRMFIEAFLEKFEWAVGKKNIPAVIEGMSNDHKHLKDEEYARSFIALYEGRRAGLCVLKFSTSKLNCVNSTLDERVSKGQCYLDHICVDASFRGKGVGKALLDVADMEARKRGCRNIYLFVEATNRAKNLYERHGYVSLEKQDGCLWTYCAFGKRYFYKMSKPL